MTTTAEPTTGEFGKSRTRKEDARLITGRTRWTDNITLPGMTITGKPAQFGRGVISDVADKIIGQFAACVARKLGPAEEEAAPVAVSATAASEATSDIPTTPARGAPRAAAPAGGSEAISDSVLERVSTNGAAVPGTSEAEAPATDMPPSIGS